MSSGDFAVGIVCLLIVGFLAGFHVGRMEELTCQERLPDGRQLKSVTQWLKGYEDLQPTRIRCVYEGGKVL